MRVLVKHLKLNKLEDDFATNLSTEKIAEKNKVSYQQLAYFIKKKTGLGVKEFRREQNNPRYLNKEYLLDQIIDKYKEGLLTEDIAKELQTSLSYIRTVVRKAGYSIISLKNNAKKKVVLRREKHLRNLDIVREYQIMLEDDSINQKDCLQLLGAKFNLHYLTIKYILSAYEVNTAITIDPIKEFYQQYSKELDELSLIGIPHVYIARHYKMSLTTLNAIIFKHRANINGYILR